jgi:hypothetical protein
VAGQRTHTRITANYLSSRNRSSGLDSRPLQYRVGSGGNCRRTSRVMATATTETTTGMADLHFSPTPQPSPPAAPSQAHEDAASTGALAVATDLLTFSDVPTELSHLSFATGHIENAGSATNQNNNNSSSNHTDNINKSSPRAVANTSPASDSAVPANGQDFQHSPSPSTQSQFNSSAGRKPSPGLAARLKALGFGVSKKTASPTTPLHDQIGRLNEDQLRELDEKHRANSLSAAIARRGRPWKGAGATLSPYDQATDADSDARRRPSSAQSDTSPGSSLSQFSHSRLPVIDVSPPLAMDTQKYRLPDHTNGNGTKVTLDTRREHLEREAISLSADDASLPPPPPPKDTPPIVTPPVTVEATDSATESTDYVPGLGSYFTPGHNRPGSIYTLSRASFANQLAQLTSLQLPDAESLSSKVTAIPTAQVAAKALINAADQIRSWISKASEVIGGLDGEDDVEWSAAGGREGLAEVEGAISRFEELINVYISAIEELQGRNDIANVPADDLNRAVTQMEMIIEEWAKIRATLKTVRGQVEIAMEWEELWNNVLGDIQGEMDELSRLVFEMEERRHKSIAAAASGENVDIGDLETIVEDTPPHTTRRHAQNRISMPTIPMSPSSPGPPSLSQDDSSLLALFARMQPLKASLEFLPMRLSVFQTRADKSFPTACEELEMRREGLDGSYKKLEKDAESLRRELGEDRWVIVFRGAGRQAQKMNESVERSLLKLREAIDSGMHLTNQPGMMKKLESFEAKKTHYGSAIERILSIIDRGIKDRLTVNGEILRLHTDLESKWMSLKGQIQEMDAAVEELQVDHKSQHLRDSVSSMLSNDLSTLASGHETPGSSPPSSVIMSSLGMDPYTPVSKKTRSSSVHSHAATGNRRQSSLPAPTTAAGRTPVFSRLSTVHSSSTTPIPKSRLQRPSSTIPNRPGWNSSTNTTNLDTGHNFKPLNLTTPSPYSKKSPLTQRSASVTPGSSETRLPTLRSPLGRSTSESPRVEETPTRTGHSRLSFRERLATTPGPYSQQTLSKPRLSAQSSVASDASNRRSSLQPPRAASATGDRPGRPASSLASTSRRTSLFPSAAKSSKDTAASTGRTTPLSRIGLRKKETETADTRPRWR